MDSRTALPRWLGTRVALTLALLLALPLAVLAGEGNPHEAAAESDDCDQCHAATPTGKPPNKGMGLPNMKLYKKDGVEMCADCHDAADSSHKVGMEMDFEPPADLPLGEDQTITCLTCHYVHGPLQGDRPWAAVSFMDRLTNHERLRKTYLLRRNNAQGELCLTCHDTSKK